MLRLASYGDQFLAIRYRLNTAFSIFRLAKYIKFVEFITLF